ncbi:hypothetical protein [Actinopolymorpha pittospori]|uniref:ATP-dependent DNA ligase n=1 Tax=Actinopolymorpha pittospori TaxID=648752 RepID=UPI003B58A82E
MVGALYAYLPPGTIVDPEIVLRRHGRLDLNALQRRYAQRRHARELAGTQPVHLVVFDVLETAQDGALRRRGLRERRAVLERLFRRVPARSPMTLAMQTSDPAMAEEWFDTMAVAGVGGLAIKPANSPYVSGARVWLKRTSRQTTDAVIGGVTGSLHRPAALLLEVGSTLGSDPLTYLDGYVTALVHSRHGSCLAGTGGREPAGNAGDPGWWSGHRG